VSGTELASSVRAVRQIETWYITSALAMAMRSGVSAIMAGYMGMAATMSIEAGLL
jgi:hypothetical protein